jgi:hypothetical protein
MYALLSSSFSIDFGTFFGGRASVVLSCLRLPNSLGTLGLLRMIWLSVTLI